MKQIPGGVTAAKGFEAAGVEAGIKYKNRMDMALVYSQAPCKAAGTFTTNVVKAAPVKWDYKVVHESDYAQAVIINAGVAMHVQVQKDTVIASTQQKQQQKHLTSLKNLF